MITRSEFLERLEGEKPLLMDGAMGTVLYGLGVPLDRPLDLLNLENPKLVADVHRAYIEAGADVIETNTFSANRFKLGKHAVSNRVAEINSAAVSIARRVIDSEFRPVLLAGSVGPLAVTMAPLGRVTVQQVKAAFTEQITALLEPLDGTRGVDLLILETMSNLQEVRIAVEVARHLNPHLPIVAQMTFTREDRTLLGSTPSEVAWQLERLGVEAIGANCGSGPAQLMRVLQKMREMVPDMPFSASPNAGWPEDIEGGRVLYPATPRYFGDYIAAFHQLGVRIVGGCCGTSAEHIAAMRQAIDHPPADPRPLPVLEVHTPEEKVVTSPDRPTHLAQALKKGEFVAAVEMTPPHGIAAQKMIAGARALQEAGANFFTVADMPQAQMRMSAWAAAHLLQQTVGEETILHFPTRGRNLSRIQGDLLAAHALGLRTLLVMMGDRAKVGDYPEADNAYDIMPGGLIQLIKQRLNAGLDEREQALDQPTHFVAGCVVNLTPKNAARELRLLRENQEHGADFALSRPVFDFKAAAAFLEAYRSEQAQPLPILLAVQPLYNAAAAEFYHNEMPGMTIPEKYLVQMQHALEPQLMGVDISHEIIYELRAAVQGICVIPPAGRYDLAAAVLDVLDEK